VAMEAPVSPTRPAPASGAQQPLPFDALPFDDESDRPIGYSLTARARRTVAPEALPPLSVVHPVATGADAATDTGRLEGATDTRPARARALRRAGTSVHRIATQLGVDDLTVRAWTGDPTGEAPATPVEPGEPVDHDDTARGLARAAAAEDGRRRLRDDPTFAAGLGLLVALAEVDRHAVTLATAHPEVLGRTLAWLRDHAELDLDRLRVVLRLASAASADRQRHGWATCLDVPVERVVHTRWHAPPSPDAAEALVRIHDAALAATVAGWRDALLAPDEHPTDLAF
jgi:hypothetical protein